MSSLTVPPQQQSYDTTEMSQDLAEKRADISALWNMIKNYLSAGEFDHQAQVKFSQKFHTIFTTASMDERIAAARLLARKRNIPKDVLLLLCCDSDRVAAPILACSDALNRAELTTQILQGTMAHRQAIAQRCDLTPTLVGLLMTFGEAEVAHVLLSRQGHLPDLSSALDEKIQLLASADQANMRHRTMTHDADPLDDLVASMEHDWCAHYKPDALDSLPDAGRDSSPQSVEITPKNEAGTEIGDEAEPEPVMQGDQPGISSGVSFEDAMDNLRAETSPMVNSNKQETASASKKPVRRVSFKIGADDEENAPLPSLEEVGAPIAGDESDRFAHISFGKGVDTQPAEREMQSAETIEIGYDSEPATASKPTPLVSEESKLTSHITLSVRKRGAEGVDSAGKTDTAIESDATLADTENVSIALDQEKDLADFTPREIVPSATDDDWQDALAKLETEFGPLEQQPSMSKGFSVSAVPASPAPAAPVQAETMRNVEAKEPSISIPTGPRQKSADASASIPADSLKGAPLLQEQLAILEQEMQLPSGDTIAVDTMVDDTIADVTPPEVPETEISLLETELSSDRAPLIQDGAAADRDASISIPTGPRRSEPDLVQPASLPDTVSPSSSTDTPIHEHAPMGFMPNMVSFAGLELVEAEPDLPSATELLLAQQGSLETARAAPAMELVEPIELIARSDEGDISSFDGQPLSLMGEVSRQLASEKAARAYELARDGDEAAHEEYLDAQLDNLSERVSDLRQLASMKDHHFVEADEYAALRNAEQEASSSEPASKEASPDRYAQKFASEPQPTQFDGYLSAIAGSASGVADRFYSYDDGTRLGLLQAIMINVLPELASQRSDINRRVLLDEALADELVMARFSTDRIRLSELLHDISGHRRMDILGLLQDKGGEALVVYLYHIGLDESRTMSMLLHGPDAADHDYAKIAQLATLYDQLYPAAASKIMDQMFGLSRRKPQHQPIHDDGAGLKAARLRAGGIETGQHRENGTIAPRFGRRQSFTNQR